MMGYGSYSHTNIRESIKIGNFTSIAAHCIFHNAHDNHLCVYNRKVVFTTNWDQPHPGEKEIEIGSDVWIGEGVRVLPGVTIGDGAIIGAGAVIGSDVEPYAVVVGNPGRITRFRFTSEQIEKLLQIKWFDWPEEDVAERKKDLMDIDSFLANYG